MLLNESSTLKALLDHLTNPLIAIDNQRKIIYINESYIRFLELEQTVEDLIGKDISQVIPNSLLPLVLETGIGDSEVLHKYPNGKTAIGSRTLIRVDGKVIGAMGYILFEEPQELQTLAYKYRKLEKELKSYKKVIDDRSFSKYTFNSIIGHSNAIIACKRKAFQIAETHLPVLILGENGVGKEYFAHAIHDYSTRKYGPMIRVNCGAIPSELFEAEFFGYEAGAFTGAKSEGKKGYFEMAERGTLFLDEITELPLFMQTKLLRVIQEKEFIKIGGDRYYNADVRIIAASNHNIINLTTEGKFRKDLFYRLNTLVLDVPPLRNRKKDILPLVNHFVKEYCDANLITPKAIDDKSLDLLFQYEWPGNVRELKNVIERALVFTKGDCIQPQNISIDTGNYDYSRKDYLPLKEYLKIKEKEYIDEIIEKCNGNKTLASELLGIHRTSLYNKL
ncbi:MAG: sigma 54-interacting transcriptional regulator [Eubacteriales bacterium]|nr:sigma 54-interacting transcriptional regulator [Eubacteriales bacterium]